jgi:hypothetical protein
MPRASLQRSFVAQRTCGVRTFSTSSPLDTSPEFANNVRAFESALSTAKLEDAQSTLASLEATEDMSLLQRALVRNLAGLLALSKSEIPESLKELQAALDLIKEQTDRTDEDPETAAAQAQHARTLRGKVLQERAVALSRDNNIEGALEALTEARDIAAELDNPLTLAMSEKLRANLCLATGDAMSAKRAAQAAKLAFGRVAEMSDVDDAVAQRAASEVAKCGIVVARAAAAMNALDESNSAADEVILMDSAGVSKGDHFLAYMQLGSNYTRMSDAHKGLALSSYKEAVGIARDSGDRDATLISLDALAHAHARYNEVDEAIEATTLLYQAALDDSPPQPAVAAQALVNMGKFEMVRESWDNALEYFTRARAEADKCEAGATRATANLFTTTVHLKQKNLVKAGEMAGKLLRETRDLQHSELEREALAISAEIAMEANDANSALSALAALEEVDTRLKTPPFERLRTARLQLRAAKACGDESKFRDNIAHVTTLLVAAKRQGVQLPPDMAELVDKVEGMLEEGEQAEQTKA